MEDNNISSNKISRKILIDDDSEEITNNEENANINLSELSLEKNKINLKNNNKKEEKKKNNQSNKIKNNKNKKKEIIHLVDYENSEESIKINKKKKFNKKEIEKKSNKTDKDSNIEEADYPNNKNSENGIESINDDLDYQEIKCSKIANNLNSKDLRGNGNLHYLPFKMNYDGFAKVDTYFESIMKKKETNTNINVVSTIYKTSFRGRIFNGKKISTYLQNGNSNNEKSIIIEENQQADFGVIHSNIRQDKDNNAILEKGENLENFFVWKFDEDFEAYNNNNFLNLNRLIDDLNKFG